MNSANELALYPLNPFITVSLKMPRSVVITGVPQARLSKCELQPGSRYKVGLKAPNAPPRRAALSSALTFPM